MELSRIKWKFIISNKIEVMSSIFLEQSMELISQWLKHFPKESTWIENNYGVPSIIIRLDCIMRDGVVHVYEIEDRPAGVGISSHINSCFRSRLEEMVKKWPPFVSVISSSRSSNDDALWIPVISIEEARSRNSLLLIRAEPGDEAFIEFQSRSISTLVNEGSKLYGEGMGLWRAVTLDDFDELPWADGFCLKPKEGSRCRGVEIWIPGKQNGKRGASTRSQVMRGLSCFEQMYLQELINPLEEEFEGRILRKIYRVYFGYNPQTKQYECLGGLWVARPNLKVHGATDSVAGPITI